MFNLLATRRGRLAAFFLLYVTEGIPLGFTATAIATYMRKRGLGPAEIGAFVATLYLPWAWKWAAGPFVDLFYSDRLGRRRAWIVACQAAMALTLLVAMPIDFATRLGLFTLVILVHNAFAAVQDVAIDALAVSVLPAGERGLANGLMFAGAYIGNGVGGAGVLFLAPLIGFNATFPFVVGAILAVTLLVALPLREPRGQETSPTGNGSRLARAVGEVSAYGMTALRAMVGSRASFAGLVLALMPGGSYALSLGLATNLAVDLGMSDAAIAWQAVASAVLAATGCVVGGALSDRLGRRRSYAAYAVLTAVPTTALALYFWHRGWGSAPPAGGPAAARDVVAAFTTAILAFSFAQGLIYGTRTALFMDLCEPKVAATQFTAYMALLNLVIAYSAWWQGKSIARFGYPATLLLDSVVGLACLAVLPLTLRPRPPRGFEVLPAAQPPTGEPD